MERRSVHMWADSKIICKLVGGKIFCMWADGKIIFTRAGGKIFSMWAGERYSECGQKIRYSVCGQVVRYFDLLWTAGIPFTGETSLISQLIESRVPSPGNPFPFSLCGQLLAPLRRQLYVPVRMWAATGFFFTWAAAGSCTVYEHLQAPTSCYLLLDVGRCRLLSRADSGSCFDSNTFLCAGSWRLLYVAAAGSRVLEAADSCTNASAGSCIRR